MLVSTHDASSVLRVPVFHLCDWLNQEILITCAGASIMKEKIKLRYLEQLPLLHPPKYHCKMRLRCSNNITYCRSVLRAQTLKICFLAFKS